MGMVAVRRQVVGVWTRPTRFKSTRQALLLQDYVIKGKNEKSGSVVSVAGGYLRNFLMPRNVAVAATKRNVAAFLKRGPDTREPRRIGYKQDLISFQPSHKQPLEAEELFAKLEEVVHPPPWRLTNKMRGPMNRYR